MRNDWPRHWLLEQLGYDALDASLFEAALTHRSAGARNNERLEFLGDAVLNLLVAEQLYQRFPTASEGDLSRLRSRVVSADPLAEVALSLQMGDQLRLGSGELKTGGFRRQSILADALEAVIGAAYLDRGIDAARTLVGRLFESRLEALPRLAELKDPKTRLQELLQSRGLALPSYVVESVEGEAHAQQFLVRCDVPALGLERPGEGSSRRRAEQQAAERILDALQVVAT